MEQSPSLSARLSIPANQDSKREKRNREFGADGTLLYIVRGRDKDEVMRLTYTVLLCGEPLQ